MNWLALGRDLDQPPDSDEADLDSDDVRNLRARIVEQYAAPFNAVFDSPEAAAELGEFDRTTAMTLLIGPLVTARLSMLPEVDYRESVRAAVGGFLHVYGREKLGAARSWPSDLGGDCGRSAAVGWGRATGPAYRVRIACAALLMVTILPMLGCGRGAPPRASAASSTAPADPAPDAGAVKTQSGSVRGLVAPGYLSFQGIPYAAPPIGAQRWRPPQPAAHWDGVRDASKAGPRCNSFMDTSGRPRFRQPR